jgi:hypothetical protein
MEERSDFGADEVKYTMEQMGYMRPRNLESAEAHSGKRKKRAGYYSAFDGGT